MTGRAGASLLKLVAGMLGISLGELVQREPRSGIAACLDHGRILVGDDVATALRLRRAGA